MATKKKITKKKSVAKKSVAKKSAAKRSSRGVVSSNVQGEPCICIKKIKYWYCMKQLPDGSLLQCDGPFKTQQICEQHVCR